jgi:hypothetical protein
MSVNFFLSALASSTVATYESYLAAYSRFCTSHNVKPQEQFPPTEAVLIGFASFLAGFGSRPLAAATVRKALTAVRSGCAHLGVPLDAFDSPSLELLLRGIARSSPGTARPPRLPITVELLAKLLPQLSDSYFDRMIAAALCVGVYGLLRGGEFSFKGERYPVLLRSDVTFSDDCLTLHLRESKTDFLRRGVNIRIFANSSSTDPVSRMRALMLAASSKRPDAPAFQLADGSPLPYRVLLQSIKSLTARAGFDPRSFGAHSLRIGGATSLASRGTPAHLIRCMGRWRSVSYQLYTRVSDSTLRQASVAMSRTSPKGLFGGLTASAASAVNLDNIDTLFKLR